MTITEFLLARIAEDESLAQEGIARARRLGVQNLGSSEAWLPDDIDGVALSFPRVLAECHAKRAIIELAEEASGLDASVDLDRAVGPRDFDAEPYVGDVILRQLAAVYADHPDYDPDWRH